MWRKGSIQWYIWSETRIFRQRNTHVWKIRATKNTELIRRGKEGHTVTIRTDEHVQGFLWHVLIDQNNSVLIEAVSNTSNYIWMVQNIKGCNLCNHFMIWQTVWTSKSSQRNLITSIIQSPLKLWVWIRILYCTYPWAYLSNIYNMNKNIKAKFYPYPIQYIWFSYLINGNTPNSMLS
jgi:hypothetical protein